MSLSDKNKFEFEIRNIGGSDVYYKRNIGDKLWLFSTKEEFELNKNIMDKKYSESAIEKGTEIEMEHAETIKKFMRDGVSVKEVARAIAIDHLEESPTYYEDLKEEYADGGNVWSKNGITIVNGDYTNRAEIIPSNLDDRMKGNYFVVFKTNGKESNRSWFNSFENYQDALKYAKENVNKQNEFANGGGVFSEERIPNEFISKYNTYKQEIPYTLIFKKDNYGIYTYMETETYTKKGNFNQGNRQFYKDVKKYGVFKFDNNELVKVRVNINKLSVAKEIIENDKKNNSDINFADGGGLSKRIECHNPKCDWSWSVESGGDDLYVCHKCHTDNEKFYVKGGSLENDFEIEENEDGDRITISLKGIGEVILVQTSPEYEFTEDIDEDTLEELNVSDGDMIGKIEHLEVNDKFKGKGYAKSLMNKAIEIAEEYGWMPLYLNASPMGSKRYGLNIEDLTGFYETFGFKVFLEQGNNNLMLLNEKENFSKGGLIAPNGKPSNLTPEQYDLVRKPEFKAWFGDWENSPETSSKIIGSNGEPLPVYHGTNAEPFVIFYEGSYFTDDYMNADGYASGEMVYEVFLNIKNPLIINARGRKWDNLKNKYGNSTGEVVGQLDVDKYDGVIFNNINDNWFDDEMGDTQNVYYTINPNQIKLADGTNTTFDGNNPDIRFDGGGDIKKIRVLDTTILTEKDFEQNFNLYNSIIERNKGNVQYAIDEKKLILSRIPFTTWYLELKKGEKLFEFLGNIYEVYSETKSISDGSYKRRNFKETLWGIKSIEITNEENHLRKYDIITDVALRKTKEDLIRYVNFVFENLILKKNFDIIMPKNDIIDFEDGGKIQLNSNKGKVNLKLSSYEDVTELVPVSELLKLREFDRNERPKYSLEDSKDNISKLEKALVENGVEEPLIIEYSLEDNSVLLIEGNHRLNVAENLGFDYLPARVVLRRREFTPLQKTKALKVKGFNPDRYGYVPSDLKPSQVGIGGTTKAFEEGGVVEGQLHSECNEETGCGEKYDVGGVGHIIEVERDEAVIVSKAFQDNNQYEIKGTPSEIASALNVLGDGKNFDSGAEIKSEDGKKVEVAEIKKEAKNTGVETIDPNSIIINRRTMYDKEEYVAKGTPKEIASQINNLNDNGVKIVDGGSIKKA